MDRYGVDEFPHCAGRRQFVLTLETLALKKSANIHIFERVKKELDARSASRGEGKKPAKERKAKTDKHIRSEAEGEIQIDEGSVG